MDVSMEDLARQIVALREELDSLRRVAMFGKQIDLIDFGQLRGYVYTDDLCYKQIDSRYKGKRADRPLTPLPVRSIQESYDAETTPLLATLFCHFWLHSLDFTFFDIGCQYGFSSVAIAQLIRSFGRANRVHAFDPGVAAELTPYNLALNGLGDQATFERMAVSQDTRPTVVFSELGHSENNRIVNRARSQELLSYPVMATSIDDYVESRQLSGHLILKVDTQGGEVEVFLGMSRVLAQRHVVAITEFTPDAIRSRVDPGRWLSGLAEHFHILDAGNVDMVIGSTHRMPVLETGAAQAFLERVEATPGHHTDLALIPRTLPKVASLLERVSG